MHAFPRAALALALALPLPAWAAGKTEITWYGHAAFVVKTPGGTVLAIDPWFSNPKSPDPKAAETIERVDYVLVTHGHRDHIGDAIAIATRTGARLVASFDLGRTLLAAGYPEAQAGVATLGNIGGTIAAGDATVTIVPAVHSSDVTGEGGQRPGGNPTGFVIRVKGGPTLYHTGDTDAFGDMKLIPERFGKVDVMLACIGGHFTMDPAGAALAASLVRPGQIVPMHHGTFPVLAGTPEALTKALRGKTKVTVLEPGKPQAF